MQQDEASFAKGSAAGTTLPRYRPDIDGLRGIAVLATVLYHAAIPGVPGGFAGIDVFFVISGYLIGGIVFRDVERRQFSVLDFYARRARRILPALLTVTLATLLAGVAILSPDELRVAARSGVAALFGGSNLVFWRRTDYFQPAAEFDPFLMTWSLGVEEQFYLVLPAILILARLRSRGTVLVTVAALTLGSLALSIIATPIKPQGAFYLLPTRFWELGTGVVLAIATIDRAPGLPPWAREAMAAAALAGLIATIILIDDSVPFPGYAAILPVLATAALIGSEGSWIGRRVLAAAPIAGLGLISYSWYLWHWPMMAFARLIAAGDPRSAVLPLVVVLSLGIAFVSWRYVEQPFRRRTLPSGRILLAYSAALAAAAALPLALLQARGWPQRIGPDDAVLAALQPARRERMCLANGRSDRPVAKPRCDTPGNGARVALWGDSHANALAPAVRTRAQRAGLGFVQLTKGACPPLLGATRRSPGLPAHWRKCADFTPGPSPASRPIHGS